MEHLHLNIVVNINGLVQQAKDKGEGPFIQFGSAQKKKKKKSVSLCGWKMNKMNGQLHKRLGYKVTGHYGVMMLPIIAPIIASTHYAFWDVLLLTIEDVIALTRKILQSKDYIKNIEFRVMEGQGGIKWGSSCQIDENLVAYKLRFGDSCLVTWQYAWGVEIQHHYQSKKLTAPFSNWLDLEVCRLPLVVTERIPTCWLCVEISHLWVNWPVKNDPEKAPECIWNSLPPTMVKIKK